MTYFCSRDTAYRDPFGAVAENTAVHFRLHLPRALGCRGAFLRLHKAGDPERQEGLFWAGEDGDGGEWWECHFAPNAVGIFFYDFLLQTDGGWKTLSAGFRGGADLCDGGDIREMWQLTCYDKQFKTPDWLAGGVMYQIFPDRFYNSGTPKTETRTDRVLHERFDEEVGWKPDFMGRVHNDDFFGGDLKGIEQKLDYLSSLGVTCLYLNPIFEAFSNHRYDTACYERVDGLLGSEDDLRALCAAAKERGMRVLLDGVFSHTGDDSVYFNRYGRYDTLGAFQSKESPYFSWYRFHNWPESYQSWWGIDVLPEVEETDPGYLDYMTGEGGILRRWIKCGTAGWRLDVADELPDPFLFALRATVKAEDPDALVLGEVWEDASRKESYGALRPYLLGGQLDSVMNYPFAAAIMNFLRGGDAGWFYDAVERICEHYPPQVTRLLMNHIGTHDTPRALTALAGEPDDGRDRYWKAEHPLTDEQRAHGKRLLKLAAVLQYCLPGVPSVYYGDEAGMEGYGDPFCRRPYPWGREDAELVAWYRALGEMRKTARLQDDGFEALSTPEDVAAFVRTRNGAPSLVCAVNRSGEEREVEVSFPVDGFSHVFGTFTPSKNGVKLPAFGCLILF